MYNLFLYKIDKTASRREPWNAHYFEWRLLKIFFLLKDRTIGSMEFRAAI
jgi:hypothetical protein